MVQIAVGGYAYSSGCRQVCVCCTTFRVLDLFLCEPSADSVCVNSVAIY